MPIGWTVAESRHISIGISSQGIEVVNTSRRPIVGTPRSIGWQAFDRITVSKRDRITVDTICMAFERDDRVVLEINEEMTGWADLVEALPNYLDGVMKADIWYGQVVGSAFEARTTTIYAPNVGPVSSA